MFASIRSWLPSLNTQATGAPPAVRAQLRAQRERDARRREEEEEWGAPPARPHAQTAGKVWLPVEWPAPPPPPGTAASYAAPTAASNGPALSGAATVAAGGLSPASSAVSASAVPPQPPRLPPRPRAKRIPTEEEDEDATVDASIVDLEQQSLLPSGSPDLSSSAGSSSMRLQSSTDGPVDWSIWCNNGDPCGIVCVGFTWFLLLWPAWMLYSRILGPWDSMWVEEDGTESWWGRGLMGLYAFLASMALTAHTKAMCTDPGAIPYGCLPLVPAPEGQQFPACVHCAYNYKPPRAHHCSTCGRCVSKMDHRQSRSTRAAVASALSVCGLRLAPSSHARCFFTVSVPLFFVQIVLG